MRPKTEEGGPATAGPPTKNKKTKKQKTNRVSRGTHKNEVFVKKQEPAVAKAMAGKQETYNKFKNKMSLMGKFSLERRESGARFSRLKLDPKTRGRVDAIVVAEVRRAFNIPDLPEGLRRIIREDDDKVGEVGVK